jgi:drug/metabolite transporter (DMT)-like permease
VFTGLANVTYWEIYRVIPVAVVSTIMYLDPASAVIWAFVFLDETPNLVAWMGILLVVVGGVVAATATRDKEVVVGQPHLSGQ